jgi:DNA-directed RNA polymerase subunit RPC12/RpoP
MECGREFDVDDLDENGLCDHCESHEMKERKLAKEKRKREES